MDVAEAIERRRAFRALLHDPVDDDVVRELAGAVRLSPSANDLQPWRLVFVRESATINELRDQNAFPDFNQWVLRGAMFVAVCGAEADDATIDVPPHKSYSTSGENMTISKRPLYLFDLGIASAFLMLRATELELVAHPIAGYDESVVKSVLGIPDATDVVAMLIVGKRSDDPSDLDSLPADLQPSERKRPERMDLAKFAFGERFNDPIG